MELRISYLLRYGVLASGLFLAIGWFWLWMLEGNLLDSFTSYERKPLAQVIHHAVETSNWAMLISLLGLAILVLLPVIRVLLTGVLFTVQKEKILAGMSYFVFMVLVFSFFLGISH